MTNFKTTLLAATMLALPMALAAPAAQAQPVSGLYVAGGAGVNWLTDQDHSASTNSFTLSEACCDAGDAIGRVNGKWTAESRIGFGGVVSLGWGFGNGLRAELEGSFRSNLYHGDNFSGSMSSSVDGNFQIDPARSGGHIRGRTDQYGAMVNALYDMNIGATWIYPYVGVGVGYVWQRFVDEEAGGGGRLLPDGRGAGLGYRSGNETVGRFAYQGIVGAAFPVSGAPGLSITAEYRFLGTAGSPSMSADGGGGGNIRGDRREGGGNSITSAKTNEAYNHSILLGLRYAFNAAPAAVMAAPVVAPAGKSFLVFFDWDKSTLTDRARGIIREAAAASKATQHTRIEVNGYADTSGNPKYNQGISMRRAQTVAAELVRNGVAKGEIAIKAFGDTVLLVPTGPGVREPQNRRVEIIIR